MFDQENVQSVLGTIEKADSTDAVFIILLKSKTRSFQAGNKESPSVGNDPVIKGDELDKSSIS